MAKKKSKRPAPNVLTKDDGAPASVWGTRFPFFYGIYLFVRARIVQGIFLILPIAVTFWILHWLYSVSRDYVIDPIAYFVTVYLLGQPIFRSATTADGGVSTRPGVTGPGGRVTGDYAITAGQTTQVVTDSGLPVWMENFVAPLIALAIVFAALYFLGMFFQSRLHQAVDWILLRVPVVTTIYSAVRNVVESLQQSKGDPNKRFQRIVLVTFPHPGIRVPAFVTSSCTDKETGKTILCVYAPTTPLPTAGYLLMVPEEDVVDIDWDVNETLAAIVSGGITVPKEIGYWSPDEVAAQRRAATETIAPRRVIQGSTPRPATPPAPKPAEE
ncbi:MAG TPA: DUF502 domain-containing protein [Pirellulaceae bacterium]|nr:DUF502 domain-containing protein [Pirellulaceae bacterium]